jgi:hypothetical protein
MGLSSILGISNINDAKVATSTPGSAAGIQASFVANFFQDWMIAIVSNPMARA